METQLAVIGALIFILLFLVSNFVMFAIARGAAKGKSQVLYKLFMPFIRFHNIQFIIL